MKYLLFFLILPLLFCMYSCNSNGEKLPVLQNPNVAPSDTNRHKIADFSFTDQDNKPVTNKTFANKIYVADFIFLSCSTICPLMNTEMLKVYNTYKNDDRVLFLSHTIDPLNDSIQKLRNFALNLGVSTSKWHFVTGNKDSIYKVAERDYFTSAYKDSTDKDGFVHTGGLVLVDKNRNIRGVYDGTEPSETSRLIADINLLLKEQF